MPEEAGHVPCRRNSICSQYYFITVYFLITTLQRARACYRSRRRPTPYDSPRTFQRRESPRLLLRTVSLPSYLGPTKPLGNRTSTLSSLPTQIYVIIKFFNFAKFLANRNCTRRLVFEFVKCDDIGFPQSEAIVLVNVRYSRSSCRPR